MRRQVEHNRVRYTGLELGPGVVLNNTVLQFDVDFELDDPDADDTALYDIILIDDAQGMISNTKVTGALTLSAKAT